MFGFVRKTTVDVKGLETKSVAMFNILNSHGVFGTLEGTRLEVERRGFINSITSHATGEDSRHYLELTYPSCVRLIINTTIFSGAADFSEFEAYDHPRKNDRIDYDALSADLRKAFNEFAAW